MEAIEAIDAIIFEPVGVFAEFSPDDLRTLARAVADVNDGTIERLENDAVRAARLYEDVAASLSELRSMGIRLVVASSLSTSATAYLLDRASLGAFFETVWTRDRARNVRPVPLVEAVASLKVEPRRVLFVTDTAQGLEQARNADINPVLMMNDPDEAMRLTAHNPAGGIVSLHELPDFVRFVTAQALAGRSA